MSVRRYIHTSNEIEALWNWLGYLGSSDNAKDLLLRKIRSDNFGIDCLTLLHKKAEAMNLGKHSSVFSIITEDVVERNAQGIARFIVQARQLFHAARNVSEIASPILYYYGMLSLAEALILSIYDFTQSSKKDKRFYTHGLSINRDTYDDLTVKPLGHYARLHDCYSIDPELYLNEPRFSLKELLSVNPDLAEEYRLVYGEEPRIKAAVLTHIDVDLAEYEVLPINGQRLDHIDSIFLTMFILCSKARYRPVDWIEQAASRRDSFILRSFLTKAERRYPNLILNRIWNEVFLFGPAARWG